MLAQPPIELMKGDSKNWASTPEVEQAFTKLKQRFMSAPVLAHFDPARPVIVGTDASDFALGTVLSQQDDGN